MRRVDPRLIIGILLIFGGLLGLLDVLGIISNAGGIFWGLLFAAGSLVFLYLTFSDRNNWWAAFPGFTLLGLAVSAFLPDSLEAYDGLVFFGGISLGFWWVYFTDQQYRWWAIMPAGVLLTLGVVDVLEEVTGVDAGGSFFIGLGLTFILVAILPGGSERWWAWIPGIALLVFGVLLGTPFAGFAIYFWPALLIVLGGFLIVRFLRNRSLS